MTKRRTPRRRGLSASDERKLEAIYAEIPGIPDCDGRCAEACGPIAMFTGEWERVKRSKGSTPRVRDPLTCPMLSPTGSCTVYSVRPYICRLWGGTKELACPHGCQPERWLTIEESMDIFHRIKQVAGPDSAGPIGSVEDLWEAIGLVRRAQRSAIVDHVRGVVQGGARREP